MKIYNRTLVESMKHETTRIDGRMKRKVVFIFIDSGSTSNYSERLVQQLKYCTVQTKPLIVIVASGHKLESGAVGIPQFGR